jgi:hypothetical protein
VAGQETTERRSIVSEYSDDEISGADVDVLGLYQPDVAAAAATTTASDQGSGPMKIDD